MIHVMHIINNFSSKDKLIMKLVRHLVLTCMHHNIYIKSTHLSGKLNVIPDLLSREQVTKAKQLAPHLDQEPTIIPQSLQLQVLLGI